MALGGDIEFRMYHNPGYRSFGSCTSGFRVDSGRDYRERFSPDPRFPNVLEIGARDQFIGPSFSSASGPALFSPEQEKQLLNGFRLLLAEFEGKIMIKLDEMNVRIKEIEEMVRFAPGSGIEFCEAKDHWVTSLTETKPPLASTTTEKEQ